MTAKQMMIDLPEDFFPEDVNIAPKILSPLAAWAGARVNEKGRICAKEKRTRTTVAASAFNRTRAETQGMMDSGDWSACTARHFLALYDLMHEKIYGIESGMTASERHTAVLRTGSFVKREFSGDYDKALDYFRWLWTREQGREKWRRENGRDTTRLILAFCYSSSMLTDYRLMLTRRR
jgi:hypothetical protein